MDMNSEDLSDGDIDILTYNVSLNLTKLKISIIYQKHNCKRYIHLIQPSQRSDRDRDIIEMIMGLSNTYTNQQLNTNQQSGGGNRNYVLGSRRRSNWSRNPQDGRRTSRYLSCQTVTH